MKRIMKKISVYAWKREVRKEHVADIVPEDSMNENAGSVYECFLEEIPSNHIGTLLSGNINEPIESMLEDMKKKISWYPKNIIPKRKLPKYLTRWYGSSGRPDQREELHELENGDYNVFAKTVRQISSDNASGGSQSL